MILTIIGTIFFSFIGFVSAELVMPSGFDHECSGVWSPIIWSCHAKQILAISFVSFLPLLIFKRKKTVCISTIVSYLVFTLGVPHYSRGSFSGSPYFEPSFYTPSIFGLWVGFYALFIVFAINLVLLKVSSKYAKIGL